MIDLQGMEPGVPDLDGDVYSTEVLDQFRSPDPSLPVIDGMDPDEGMLGTVAEILPILGPNDCLAPDFKIPNPVALSGYRAAWSESGKSPRSGIRIAGGVTVVRYRLLSRRESMLRPTPTKICAWQKAQWERANVPSD